MRKKRHEAMPKNGIEYWPLYSNIKHKSRQATDKWLKENCEYIERIRIMNKASMQKRGKKLTGQKICSSTSCILQKKGRVKNGINMLEKYFTTKVREACNT